MFGFLKFNTKFGVIFADYDNYNANIFSLIELQLLFLL